MLCRHISRGASHPGVIVCLNVMLRDCKALQYFQAMNALWQVERPSSCETVGDHPWECDDHMIDYASILNSRNVFRGR